MERRSLRRLGVARGGGGGGSGRLFGVSWMVSTDDEVLMGLSSKPEPISSAKLVSLLLCKVEVVW